MERLEDLAGIFHKGILVQVVGLVLCIILILEFLHNEHGLTQVKFFPF